MKTIWIILLSVCVGGLLSTMLMRSCQVEPPLPEMMVLRDTITEVYIDINTVYEPVPYKVEIKDTVYLSSNEGIESDCQNKHAQGTLFVQEIKWFSDNSTYDMQVSGINVQLNWIKTYPQTVTKYITTTEIVYIQPQKWSLWTNGEAGIVCGKPSLPIGAKLKYIKDQNKEYYLKGGTDLLNGGPYLMGGVDVKLF